VNQRCPLPLQIPVRAPPFGTQQVFMSPFNNMCILTPTTPQVFPQHRCYWRRKPTHRALLIYYGAAQLLHKGRCDLQRPHPIAGDRRFSGECARSRILASSSSCDRRCLHWVLQIRVSLSVLSIVMSCPLLQPSRVWKESDLVSMHCFFTMEGGTEGFWESSSECGQQ
jgi:hypothetical protein